MAIKYLHPKYIFFIYTLIRFGANGNIEIPLGNFHAYSINGMIKILENFFNDGFTKEVIVTKYINSNKKEVYERWRFIKGSNFYIRDFEDYMLESEINKFTIKIEININEIKIFLKKYFQLWYDDKIERNYTQYVSAKSQLYKINSTIKEHDNERYIVRQLKDIDEISVIVYLYINDILVIENDCINILEDNDEIFFIPEINKSKFDEVFNNKDIRITYDVPAIVNNNNENIYVFTPTEREIVSELIKIRPLTIGLKQLSVITKHSQDGCRQSIKMLKRKLKNLEIDHLIDIISVRGSNEYSIKIVE